MHSAFAIAVDWIIAIVVALIVYGLLSGSLRTFLDRTIRVPSGTAFYLRALLLVLFLSALSRILMSGFDFKTPPRLLDYVWAVGGNLQSMLNDFVVIVMIYVVLVTILAVVLKPKNEQ